MCLGHGVGAAALGEGRDHLTVRGDQDGEQGGDGEGDGERETEAVAARRGQHQHDRLGTVGHGRHGVEGEGGQTLEGGEPVTGAGVGIRGGVGALVGVVVLAMPGPDPERGPLPVPTGP